jgi:hypothetical protein
MKQLLSMVAIAGTLAIITFSSCTKEDPSDSSFISPSSYSPPATPQTGNFELVADNWVHFGGQVYINTFKDVIASANASGNHTVTVYLHENGKLTQISQRDYTYMGNRIWATNNQADVSIYYWCNTDLPFSSINVRVEVR